MSGRIKDPTVVIVGTGNVYDVELPALVTVSTVDPRW